MYFICANSHWKQNFISFIITIWFTTIFAVDDHESALHDEMIFQGLQSLHTLIMHFGSFKLRKFFSTKRLWIRVQLQSLKLQISYLLRARSSLTMKQLQSENSVSNRTWHDKNIQSIPLTFVEWPAFCLRIALVINAGCSHVSHNQEIFGMSLWNTNCFLRFMKW